MAMKYDAATVTITMTAIEYGISSSTTMYVMGGGQQKGRCREQAALRMILIDKKLCMRKQAYVWLKQAMKCWCCT